MAFIEIFIGELVEHASERATLLRTVAFLSKHSISAVILANANIKGRQLDLVIGLARGVLVVESKGFTSAVRGGESGLWEVQLASGGWKEIPNAYAQALAQKLALRDAMAEFIGADVSYPDAALLFTPSVPAGSAIPKGDFKVSIGGLGQLPDLITATKPGDWCLDQWRAFATRHRLISVSSVDAAFSPELHSAERLLRTFGDAFRRTYGPLASEMVAVSCVGDNGVFSSDAILERAEQPGGILLTGPSGCGKSLLSYKLALVALERGRVPIVIPAKDFEGSLRDVANREATLLDATSAAAVISAARRLDHRLLLVVDGYNECTPLERPRLTRSIAAAVKRYDADAVVSSRVPLERDDLLSLRRCVVQVPDIEVKFAIARQAAGNASMDGFSELLNLVGSGLEARMIGQLGWHLPTGASRYGLFDAFVRERLGSAASDGIRALSRIAGMMTERICFGLSVRDLDRLSDREGIPSHLLQTLQAANILDRRGDRVSFSHEMFLNVFAAEAIIRRAGDDPDVVIAALRLPQHLEAKPFVLGAIDDDSFRRRVLSGLSGERVMRACLAGQCGEDAQRWANDRCDDLLARVAREIETVRFNVSKDFYWGVQAQPETLQNWATQDRAILAAIPYELLAGRRIDEVLGLIGQMDERLAVEHRRLREEAREKQVSLRSGLYAISYTAVGQRVLGLCQICSPVDSGHLYGGPKVAAAANIYDRLLSETLSPGQIGLLVELDKYSDLAARSIGRLLPGILGRVWTKAAHHLRLGLMNAVTMSAHALLDNERRALIATIQALPMGNGNFDAWGIVDALKSLGALDDDQDAHVATAKAEIAAVLADRDDPRMWSAAAGLWNAQFDHPYDGAYCEAWNELQDTDRKNLLLMAARSGDRFSMFVPTLIAEIASYADPDAEPILALWAALPQKREVMIGESVRGFEIAYAALARLHCPLPDRTAEVASPADQALLACGQIFYWLNRDDLPLAKRKHHCAEPLAILSCHETGVAAAVVGDFLHSDGMFAEAAKRLPGSEPIITSLGQVFPEEIAAIYRAALAQPAIQSGYFEFFQIDDLIKRAISALGQFGNAGDVPLLRAWSTHPDFGYGAVKAIKTIEEVAQAKAGKAAG